MEAQEKTLANEPAKTEAESQDSIAEGEKETKMKKFDKTYWGIFAGLILPIIGFLIYFPIKTRGADIDLETYIQMAMNNSDHRSDILITCLIPNMFFFYFTNFRWKLYEATKGLVGITLLLGVALFIMTI